MSFFRSKNQGVGEITIEMTEENTFIQDNEPVDDSKIFWIDTDE